MKIGVFDALGDNLQTVDEIAVLLKADKSLLYRLMRALSAIGLLAEDESHRFSLTDAGQLLRSDMERSFKDLVFLQECPEHYAIWRELPEMVREGKQNGFVREFEEMAFDYAAHNDEYRSVFARAMSSFSTVYSNLIVDTLRDDDFSSVAHLCDIGGGQGHLLCSLLRRFPSLHGIVFDLPQLTESTNELWADKMHVADRCSYQFGDMFRAVPTADVYLLKFILHDWNDDECLRILRTVRDAARDDGQLFIVERIVTPPDIPHISKLYDIHMMCWGSGRERTEAEYGQLLHATGWFLVGTRETEDAQLSVIEARAM